MEWIDIEVDKPQQDFEVLVCVDDDVFLSVYRLGNDCGGYFDCEVDRSVTHRGLIPNGVTVSHWMPLPEPPVLD